MKKRFAKENCLGEKHDLYRDPREFAPVIYIQEGAEIDPFCISEEYTYFKIKGEIYRVKNSHLEYSKAVFIEEEL